MLRYLNFEPSFKQQWCRARDSFGSQVPVTTGGFELRISCIRSSYLTHLYYWYLSTDLTHYSGASIIDFEQVNSCWAYKPGKVCDIVVSLLLSLRTLSALI